MFLWVLGFGGAWLFWVFVCLWFFVWFCFVLGVFFGLFGRFFCSLFVPVPSISFAFLARDQAEASPERGKEGAGPDKSNHSLLSVKPCPTSQKIKSC